MLNWIKTHKLVLLLLLIILLLFSSQLSGFLGFSKNSNFNMPAPNGLGDYSGEISMALPKTSGIGVPNFIPSYRRESPPTTDISNRMVVRESSLSLLVKNVVETQAHILKTAQSLGGYMVSTDLSNPQDAPSSTVVLRIPAKDMDNALKMFKDLSIKVVSERLLGNDVTDQYVDNQSRLDILLRTKAKFDDMLSKAITVQDTLTVQKEIINLQSQIDSIKGSQQYLEKTTQMARLTIYLSTDEIALPYAPSGSWRPDVIFKLAVRSLISNLRNLGSLAIWLGVYSIIWIPILIGFIIYKRKFANRSS